MAEATSQNSLVGYIPQNRERYTAEEVARAIIDSMGVLSVAARKLRCDRSTVVNYINRYPELKQAVTDGRAALVDAAEVGLIANLKRKDMSAIKYALSTLGKDRGWIETQKHEVTMPEGGLVVRYVNDWRDPESAT